MRTYKRRKQIHRFIDNVHENCRLCLQKIKDVETVDLFTSESEKSCPSLTMKIMICLGLEIANEDCLPSLICTECFDKINNYYVFRKKCGSAYQTLKSHRLAVKDIEVKTLATSNQQGDNEHSANADYDQCEEGTIILSYEEGSQLRISESDEIPKENSICLLNGESPHEDQSAVPEISNFLNTILLELGIIEEWKEGCLKSDFVNNFIELETGDGCQMTLQIVESNEERNSTVKKEASVITNETVPNTKIKQEEPPRKGGCRPVCEECGKVFATRGVLRRHRLVHTGERPYACRSCPRRFSQGAVLRRHELIHQENRPFPCDTCSKSFTQRGALEAHARTHLSPATRSLSLHRCSVCPKMFLHASGLSRHMRYHSGEALSCETCTRTFRDRSSLLRHRRTHGESARDASGASEPDTNNIQFKLEPEYG